MSKCKFEQFNASLDFLDSDLKDIKLIKLEVNQHANAWVFHFGLEKLVSPKVLFPYLEQVKTYFFNESIMKTIEFQMHYEDLSNINEHILDTYSAVLKELTIEKPGLLVLNNYNNKYDGKIKVLVDKESLFISDHFSIIKDRIKRYGIDVDVELEIDAELIPVSKVLESKIKETNKTAALQAEYTYNEIMKESKPQKFTSKSSPKAVKIETIPLDQYQIDQYMANEGDVNFLIEGEVILLERREFTNSILLQMTVADREDAIVCKRFLSRDKDKELAEMIQIGNFVQVSGKAKYDTYISDVILEIDTFGILDRAKGLEREDKAKEKRIEFHSHTKMSNMDAVVEPKDYITQAIKWGHKAIAFTDHNSLNAYPEIFKETKGKDIKPIYGVEIDFVDDQAFKIARDSKTDVNLKEATYVVFDIETTGFSTTRDRIIEIGAQKVVGMEIVDKFQTFVNPEMEVSAFISELTSITNDDLKDAETIDKILPEFLSFCKGAILVAHNAQFDIGHIEENARRLDLKIEDFKVIDTLNLARYFYSGELKRFGLEYVAKYFKIKLDHHHRAEDDAETTARIWLAMMSDLMAKGIKTYKGINEAIDPEEAFKYVFMPPHANILIKNEEGLHNLYKMISDSLTKHYHVYPRTLKSVFEKYRKGLLIGSGCSNGEVFSLALNKSDEELKRAIKYYDYIEVQPPVCYKHLAAKIGLNGKEVIEGTIAKIVKYARNEKKLVIATNDSHYLNKEDRLYREIYIRAKQVGGGLHPLATSEELPDQYLMTTDEMLKEMKFLGDDLAKEIVITNTNALNDKIDYIEVFKKDLYSIQDDAFKDTLGVTSIKEEVRKLVNKKALEIYGKNLHFIVKERIAKELKSIIDNEFAPIYYMSHLLVKKSLEDGYLVGSRGSVGSSLVATLLDVTEVNPLRPHYVCPKCQFTVFNLSGEEVLKHSMSEQEKSIQDSFKGIKSGFDLPNNECPHCKTPLKKNGHDIPFETFLGLEGNKIPDIDLNFSGDYQAKAHAYVRELLGEDFTFRAGTIQTVAERNAFGYVKGFFEENGLTARNAQVSRLATKVQGVKRSTGQHPGGIVVVPKNHSIFDVTPVQYPADDVDASWKTTHYDYHSFEDNLLKLDILGHDDPTMIKYLMDYVKEHPNEFKFSRAQDIPLDDKNVYRLFNGTEVIGLKPSDIDSPVASNGVPELGTPFTKQMLVDTKPNSFSGLVKVSGLSHGTDVWLKNSQTLVTGHPEYGKISFDDIIGCRDDIMIQLKSYGMEEKMAFEIMEFVRRGKPSQDKKKWLSYVQVMRDHNIPNWYIWSAGLIKYMFPKAHAVAYVIMAMRIAWFKVYKPLVFYSGFFSKRVDQFDYEAMVAGPNAIRNNILIINKKTKNEIKIKDENLIVTLGVALEMTKRGFKFLPVDIYKSDAVTFLMEEGGLRMPFITIDGLGASVAYDILERRKEREFTSIKDLGERTKINKTILDKMKNYGILEGFIEENEELNQGLFDLN